MQKHRAGPLGHSLWKTVHGETEETGLRHRLGFEMAFVKEES